eukprot:Gb_14813 [translate_table: standard]
MQQVSALILENTFTSVLDMAGVLLPFLKWFIGGTGSKGLRILNCLVRSPWNTIDIIGQLWHGILLSFHLPSCHSGEASNTFVVALLYLFITVLALVHKVGLGKFLSMVQLIEPNWLHNELSAVSLAWWDIMVKQPILFLSGSQDEMVPPSHMQRLYEKTKHNPRCMFVDFPTGMHMDTWHAGGDRYWRTIQLFLERHVSNTEGNEEYSSDSYVCSHESAVSMCIWVLELASVWGGKGHTVEYSCNFGVAVTQRITILLLGNDRAHLQGDQFVFFTSSK